MEAQQMRAVRAYSFHWRQDNMLKRILSCILGTAVFAVPSGISQQMAPRTFRFVSEWKIAPQHVAAYTSDLDKIMRPTLESLLQDGTVLDYGIYITTITEDEGITNGVWYEVPSFGAMEKVQDKLAKLPPSNFASSAIRQHDYLFRVILRNGRPARGSNGYFYLNSTLLQSGKRDQWRQWWDKYQKSMYDQFLAEGLITSYELDSGEIHTMDPNWVYLAYVIPTAEALDKINNAFRIRVEKRTPEENQAINSALEVLVVPGSHRDYLARTTSYATK